MLNALLDFFTSSLFIGAIAQGLCYTAVAVGVYMTFRNLSFPDLTIDGTLPLGAGLSGILILNAHWPPWLTLPAAMVAGALAGAVTALLTTKLRINGLLSGILVSIALYSVNLRVMDNRSNLPLLNTPNIFAPLAGVVKGADLQAVLVFAAVSLVVIVGVDYFLHTELGLTMRATGDNEQMVRALGVNTDHMILLGLALSNSLVALTGAMLAQYLGFADIGLGLGLIVAGLAAVIIGETVVKPRTVLVALLSVGIGSVIYRIAIALALRLDFDLGFFHFKLNPLDFQFATAALVVLALSLQRFDWSRIRSR